MPMLKAALVEGAELGTQLAVAGHWAIQMGASTHININDNKNPRIV